MKIYYYVDTKKWEESNRSGKDYTPAYIPEILTFLGVTGKPWTPAMQVQPEDILFVGAEEAECLPECNQIQFGTNLPALQRPERCSPITDLYVAADGTKLPLFVPVLPAEPGWQVLRSTVTGKPALTRKDKVFRFCFDLPATVWYSGDGVYPGVSRFDFFLGRVPDTRPIPDTMHGSVAYNDLLMSEIEDVLGDLGVPILYRLPPMDAMRVPDFALHFSGDDDCTSVQYNLNAASVMRNAGFPYHINAMPLGGESFVFDKEVFCELEDLGCEVALHTDFVSRETHYTFEVQKAQADLFEETFGCKPLTNVNHCFVEDGPAYERLRWLNECGIIGDNGKFAEIKAGDDAEQDINEFNLYGFSFGTAFPRYTRDDPQHGNRHIHTMEIPVNYYEPRLGGKYQDPSCITNYLDGAAEHGRISQFFLHPHYFAPDKGHAEYVANALALIREHIDMKNYKVLFTTTNQIALFWKGRSESTISQDGSGKITVTAQVPLVLKIPAQEDSAWTVNCNTAEYPDRVIRGRRFKLIILPAAGTYEIKQTGKYKEAYY